MGNIYLVLMDGYLESVVTEYFAMNHVGVKRIIQWYYKDMYDAEVRNISVDLLQLKATFEVKYPYDDTWEDNNNDDVTLIELANADKKILQ